MGDYKIYGHAYGSAPGTEDWQDVTILNLGESYEWDEFRVYYSPNARRFFWGSGSGCSCNSFEDDYTQESDFENGFKNDALSALKRYTEESYRTVGVHEYEEAVRDIKTFKENN